MVVTPKKVLIFDSGLGGLSIFQTIQEQYPFYQLIYCSDNEAFPYGNKPESELVDRVSKVLLRLNEEFSPDTFVIACNTASTVALPKLRDLIKTPVVGVVPAIKPAASVAKSPSVGLLATPGTINRAYTQSLIEQFAPNFTWIKIGSSELVQIAENKMYGEKISLDAIVNIIAPFAQYKIEELDTIVLACTHFPLLAEELKQALPNIINWIDSSEAIANRVGFLLNENVHKIQSQQEYEINSTQNNSMVFTKSLEKHNNISALVKKLKIQNIITLKV